MKNVPSEREKKKGGRLVNGWLVSTRSHSDSKEYLQLPSIEITPSSDEDGATWSNCSTPSASPRRKRFLLRKWLRVSEKKEHAGSESRLVWSITSPKLKLLLSSLLFLP
jgi:hypothetical protein